MDLFGNERKRLRQQLEDLKDERDVAQQQAAGQSQRAQAASSRARERQDRLVELQKVIDDLRGEVSQLRERGAPTREVATAQQALEDALAIHGDSTR